MFPAINRVQPSLDFVPPNYNSWLRRSLRPVMPLWTALQTQVTEIECRNVETLAKTYSDFNANKTRVLLAFRHPSPTDPLVLSHLLWRELPQVAQQIQQPIGKAHSYFIYDRGIPLWAGSYLIWIFSRLGGIPIQRGKLDLNALKTAREILLNGQFPLAVAPEGGNNGHNEIISPLEPGIAQLAFWCAEDIDSAKRDESVVIVPIGIQYKYIEDCWGKLEALLSSLEDDLRISSPSLHQAEGSVHVPGFTGQDCMYQRTSALHNRADLYGRMYRLAEHLLTVIENYYQTFYGVAFSDAEQTSKTATGASCDPSDALGERLRALLDKVLHVTEQYFSVRPKGSVIDRCRKLEQAGWDRIFREDTHQLSPVEKGLADRAAEEANLRLWHMRLVESFVAVTGRYVQENPTADRFAETLILLKDTVQKIKGKPEPPYILGKQKAIVTIGEPLNVSQQLPTYRNKRRRAIADLTQDLQTAMESLIIKS